jgi:gluconolactonase
LVSRTPRFAEIFPDGVQIDRVAKGFIFTEGPVWLRDEGCLLLSDIPGNRIQQIDGAGRITVFRDPSHNSNGLTLDLEGRLIACEHSTRRVTRTESDGRTTVLAESFEGKRLNSPNDVVVRSDGSIFFTDPAVGIQNHLQEQPVQGVYRLTPETGELELVVSDFVVPNGLAFSPDESRLYVSDSSTERHHIRVFDIHPDGSLGQGQGRVFATLEVGRPGPPDGMKLDAAGRVFCAGPGGIWVFDPSGVHLGTIETPEPPANCAWGGDDWRTLYMTARRSVYRIQLREAGIPVSRVPARTP